MKRALKKFCCCCCGGGYKSFQADGEQWNLSEIQRGDQPSVDDLVSKSRKAREQAWQALGTLEPLLQDLRTPSLSGPKWPASRQSFRLIRRPNGNVILASDGLSDPFDDVTLGEGNVNGFGLEFFIETSGEEMSSVPAEVKKSWQFQLLFTVSQLAAGHGGIRAILDDMKLLSTEAEGVHEAIPEAHRPKLVNAQGRVGALLGLQSGPEDAPKGAASPRNGAAENGHSDGASHAESGMPERVPGMPLTEVKLVNIKLLTLAELKLITDKGAEGRRRLSELFAGPGRLVSTLKRPSAAE